MTRDLNFGVLFARAIIDFFAILLFVVNGVSYKMLHPVKFFASSKNGEADFTGVTQLENCRFIS